MTTYISGLVKQSLTTEDRQQFVKLSLIDWRIPLHVFVTSPERGLKKDNKVRGTIYL